MNASADFGRRVLGAVLLLYVALVVPVRADEPAPPDSARAALCQELLEALAGGDTARLRAVLAPRDVRLTLPAVDEERLRAVDGRFSADQAALMLVERLRREAPPPAPDLGPDFLRSSDGTLAAQCPVLDPTEGNVFLVVHYGTGDTSPSHRTRDHTPRGRLYLDLHYDDAAQRWQVRAVRELR